MKRRLAQLVAFLVVGAVINFAVAWGFAAYDLSSNSLASRRAVDHASVQNNIVSRHIQEVGRYSTWQSRGSKFKPAVHWTASLVSHDDFQAYLPYWSTLRGGNPLLKQGLSNQELLGIVSYFEVANGWPLLSFRGTYLRRVTLGRPIKMDFLNEQWVIATESWDTPGASGPDYPYAPIWTGLIINTLFYAMVLWVCYFLVARLVYVATIRVRRRQRLRQSLCPHCAYPIGTSPVCTECGKAIPVSRMQDSHARPDDDDLSEGRV